MSAPAFGRGSGSTDDLVSLDLPSELTGLDRLLARTLVADEMPYGLVDRVFIASREALPAPIIATIGPDSAGSMAAAVRAAGSTARARAARWALAAAAAIAVAAGTYVSLHSPALPTSREFAVGRNSDRNGDRATGRARVVPGPAAAPEAALVALLDEHTSDQWVDEDSFGRSPFSQDVAPVLRVRNAGLDDFTRELTSIFGNTSAGASNSG